MRHIIVLDNKITEQEYRAWMKEDKAFWKQWFGVDAKYWVVRRNFSDYPTYIDDDGDIRPEYSYLKQLAKDVTKGYDRYGADFIVMCVHETNWKSDPPGPGNGIWGTAYANIYHGYHLQYCRWDKDNPANTFGTLYHERAHAFDALVKTELDAYLEPILGIRNFDHNFVHGAGDPYDYIRHKENTDGLKKIAPQMRRAFEARLRLHIKYLQGRITIWQKILRWFKEWQNKTDGVPRQ